MHCGPVFARYGVSCRHAQLVEVVIHVISPGPSEVAMHASPVFVGLHMIPVFLIGFPLMVVFLLLKSLFFNGFVNTKMTGYKPGRLL